MSRKKILDLHFISLGLLSCFPLLGMWSSIVIILFGIISIVAAILMKEKWGTFSIKPLIPFACLFCLILLRTLILSPNKAGLFYLEKSLSLLFLPLFFYVSPIRYALKDKLRFLTLFIFSALIVSTYGELRVFFTLASQIGPGEHWANRGALFSDPSYSFFVRTYFESFTSFHPSYACLYLGIAFVGILYSLIQNFNTMTNWLKWLSIFLLGIILIEQVILAARTPFIGTMVASFFMFSIMIRNKWHVVYALLGLGLLFGMMYLSIPSFAARFKEVSVNNMSVPAAGHEDSFNIRSGILQCTANLLKEHWAWGVGPGNVQQHLDNCYAGFPPEIYKDREYNTHNQFFDYWAGLGIMGPLALFCLLGFVAIINMRMQFTLPAALVLLFTVSMLTENILIRQYGGVAFSFFMGIFSFNPSKKAL